MKLYELTEQYQELMDICEETGLEFVADTIEAITGEFNEKATNIGFVNKNLSANIEMLDNEIKNLQARKKAMQNNQERLKDYLRENMQATGITKIQCPLFNITLRNPVKAVQVDDASLLPDKCVKLTVSPDKTVIKAMIKAGEDVPGAHLVDGKSAVIIK